MKRVSKKEMEDVQAMIDSMSGKTPARTPDSNTAAESHANDFLDAMAMASDETKRRNKIRKILGR